LRRAQCLLERTDEPMAVVARRAGYDAAVTMRAQFTSRLGISPRAYRQTFRGH
jgi:transcriptional regulator GlxA family with amidase domain